MQSKIYEEVKTDCVERIKEEYTVNDILMAIDCDTGKISDDFYEEVFDKLWIDDSVTGNGSGSYTFSREEAKQNVMLCLDDLHNMCVDFDVSYEEVGKAFIEENYEWMDVCIRCYHLNSALAEAIDIVLAEAFKRYEQGKEHF